MKAVKYVVAMVSATAAGPSRPSQRVGSTTNVAAIIPSTKWTRLSVSALSVGAAWWTAWKYQNVGTLWRIQWVNHIRKSLSTKATRAVGKVPIRDARSTSAPSNQVS